MKKKSAAAWLCLFSLCFTFFASCGPARRADPAAPKSVTCKAERIDLSLIDEEYVLDAEEEEGGFCVLIGTEKATDGTKETDEDGTEWTLVDHSPEFRGITGIVESTVRHYSDDFQERDGTREKSGVEYARLIMRFPDGVYTYAARPVYDFQPWCEMKELHGSSYDIYRDGDLLLSFPPFTQEGWYMDENGNPLHKRTYSIGDDSTGPHAVNPPGLRDCQYWVQDGTVYATTYLTGYAGKYLYINERQIAPPQPKRGVPVSEIHGLGVIDGQVYAVMHKSETQSGSISAPSVKTGILVPVTPETEELDLSAAVSLDAVPTGTCATDGACIWFMSGSELYRTDSKECVRITDIGMCGYNELSSVRTIRPLADGRYLMVIDYRLVLLTPSEEEFVPTVRTLVVGYLESEWLDPDLEKRIETFNRSGTNTVLKMQSYPDQSKLNLALLSEEVDLLVSTDILLLRNYADKGLLRSLEEDCPSLFGSGKLTESILEAARYRGGIYMLPRVYRLYGFQTPAGSGIPKDDLAAFLKTAAEKWPENRKKSVNSHIFDLLVRDAMDDWIDWENRTCDFDGESFLAALEYAGGCAKDEAEADANQTEARGLELLEIADPYAFQSAADGLEECQPLPSASHDGYLIFAPYYLAAVKKADGRENAEEAFSGLFLEKMKRQINTDGISWLSVNREELDEILENRAENDGSDYYRSVEKSIRMMYDAIGRADHFMYSSQSEPFKVIKEEAARYFKGEITAEKAAEYIQNRISIYLAEQG